MELARSESCKNVARVTVHNKSSSKRSVITGIFVLFYAIVLPWAWNTMGEPLRLAKEEATALDKQSIEQDFEEFDEATISWGEGEDDNIDTEDEEIEFYGEESDEIEDLEQVKQTKNDTNSTEGEEEAAPRPLPSPYLPDAGATASLFLLLCSHALFHLLCHWLVWFEVKSFYTPSKQIQIGCFLHIQPHPHRGKPAICEVYKNKRTGELEFEFQRQKFVVSGPNTGVLAAEGDGVQLMEGEESMMEPETVKEKKAEAMKIAENVGFILPLKAKYNDPKSTYLSSRGLANDRVIAEAHDRYGENTLRMESATILQLLQKQLLSPLAMFQLFSASLWLMDEYWQQTLFTIFTIVMMESTTAFQRYKTMGTLKGLAPKPFQVPCFRKGKWGMILTNQLLPGDIISLNSQKGGAAKKKGALDDDDDSDMNVGKAQQPKPKQTGTDVVPCDCLILHGSAVVNEATLTGESVPQMKDALNANTDLNSPLDMQGRDRVHVMFSGTTVVSATPGEDGKSDPLKQSPNGGCICYVLRTGFGSSQGELMQMIEFSTETVASDAKETGLALLILLVFALCSAGYVLKKGMEKGDRTTHELLLKCVIIITSVVPQTLPVQMAAAVNFAMMALMKQGIFCTEPFRLPYSGKVTHCLFDKTGTLTSDELVPVGVINKSDHKEGAVVSYNALVDVNKSSSETAMVLAACHSLIEVPDAGDTKKKEEKGMPDMSKLRQELLGDPIEIAAMKGVQWRYDPKSQTATPGDSLLLEAAAKMCRNKIDQLKKVKSNAAQEAKKKAVDAEVQNVTKQLEAIEASIKETKMIAEKSNVKEIKILNRYHFSSELQRMSVVCKIRKKGSTTLGENPYCLVKGSPEAIKALLDKKEIPSWYTSTYRGLAEEGMRVLALGYKAFDSPVSVENLARQDAEKGLSFAGFIAFECKTRSDSPMVIRSLRNAAHSVAMLTGDAPLTALHVAKQTAICGDKERKDNPPLVLTARKTKNGDPSDESDRNDEEQSLLHDEKIRENLNNFTFEWVGALGDEKDAIRIPFDHTIEGCGIEKLYQKHDLLTTEKDLMLAELKSNGKIWSGVEHIKVFARMSPQGKAKVIRKLQDDKVSKKKRFVFMCGDGGNDVGALKQADVGLALLSGYGSANTGGEEEAAATGSDKDAEAALNEHAQIQAKRARKAMKEKKKEFEIKKKQIMARQKGLLEQEMRRRELAGEPVGVSAHFQAVKKVTLMLKAELQKENQALDRKYNINLKSGTKKPKSAMEAAELAMQSLEDDPNALPVVRPGDASVAAPFTSRIPSVRSAVHMIRQGRCTLLSALQQQQIMMLECTIRAYCLAALTMEGARSSERQMIASSWLIMMAVGGFSYSSPLEEMHPVRPLRSLFHPGVFFSILAQAAIHLGCIVYAVRLATDAMGPEKLQEVIDFNRKVSAGLEKKLEESEEYNPMEELLMIWSTPFKPNLLNTVVFLVETSQTMAVFFVNYKGRPWMKGIVENHALFLSLFVTIGSVAMCAWEVIPQFNQLIHLEPFPDDHFRWQVMGLVLATIAGTFIADRVITAIFAPKVFGAMLESAAKTSIADILPIFSTLFKVTLGFILLGTGNPLIWMGCYWAYKKRKAYLEEQEEAKLD